MFRNILFRKILSAVTSKFRLRAMLGGSVATTIFVIAVTILSVALLPQEDVVKTWFPTLESMWNNIP